MKVFQCGNCQYPLYFENTKCANCGHLCGYKSDDRQMLTFNPSSNQLIPDSEKEEYKFCKNHEHDVCNWVIPIENKNRYCNACQLNRTIPILDSAKNFEKWKNLEIAKHRLIYQLQKIGLSLPSKLKNKEEGLCFDFVARNKNPRLMTGHANGVITILISEANSELREKRRKELFEPYRTLIGHLRHEVGHYFWERLVRPNKEITTSFRFIFGDERNSYSDSLKAYYAKEQNNDWEGEFISRYATAHPWEDWAETWAHYLHIMDMVETAYFFNLKVDLDKKHHTQVNSDPYLVEDFDQIIQISVPLSFAVNSINRAMGHQDVYPFVITPTVVRKLTFIHRLLWNFR
ncbi:hypothetical protein SAMN06298216_0663 [Spirosomataceae bacterium TFI 002]|nr:hypothetical protein SAMN06298216_0663 [Spirosomataceae bacterium TFI 002]